MVFRVTGAVDETGASTVGYAEQIRGLFEDLMTKARGICGGAWESGASEVFLAAQGKWDAEAGNLTNAQTEIGQLTRMAAENAFAADRKGAGLFPM
ncbi:hypothetical protein SacmaDRAFT_0249 [Saccharomonospora marina XMU15]|uniref:WXG100 family type VII secretion target n=1 Tax=Saccharomonospora marina XMU15 TaxID=882083 RepID=H5X099_9PSEU|nr:WXG100 family type VII secretion target [Saccharomonospora marina]EHR48559.1 hypothetical protein SacmaDRAFT_0249 [Saccharomonospora marina XMU15]